MDSYCFNRSNLLIIILLIIIVAIVLFFFFSNNSSIWPQQFLPNITNGFIPLSNQNMDGKAYHGPNSRRYDGVGENILQKPATTIVNNERTDVNIDISTQNTPIDIIRDYDISKINDPLVEPSRRVDRYQIPPYYIKRIVDYPTRGFPDNFIQVGILVKKGDMFTNNENKILRLFGRQEFPGSNKYDYYVMINSGLDQIKIPIKNKHQRELYDGDHVYIKELDEDYKVSLYKYDSVKYYPNIL